MRILASLFLTLALAGCAQAQEPAVTEMPSAQVDAPQSETTADPMEAEGGETNEGNESAEPTNEATEEPTSEPNELCFRDSAEDQFSDKHVETKLMACQVIGMTKQAAIDYLEKASLTVRIASEDGESFALTQDYRDDRVNLDVLVGIVVGASAW
jgi:hypothetical protein